MNLIRHIRGAQQKGSSFDFMIDEDFKSFMAKYLLKEDDLLEIYQQFKSMDTGKDNYLTRIEFSKGLGVFGVQVFIIFVDGSTDLLRIIGSMLPRIY